MALDRIDIEADVVEWVCFQCGETRSTAISGLEIGDADGNLDRIALPVCLCGMRTFIFRTWEDNVDLPHRRAINALAEHLIEIGQSHPAVAAAHEAETRVPPLMVDLSKAVEDISGRQAMAEAQEVAAAAAAAWEAGRPEREAVEAAEAAAAEAKENERLFAEAEARRLSLASAAVNKRLGLPPGSEPPKDDLADELAKSADEILADSEGP